MSRYWAGYQWRDHHGNEHHMMAVPRPSPENLLPEDVTAEQVCDNCQSTYLGDHTEDECIANLLRETSQPDAESTDDQYVGAE